jgi:hypothetical protein
MMDETRCFDSNGSQKLLRHSRDDVWFTHCPRVRVQKLPHYSASTFSSLATVQTEAQPDSIATESTFDISGARMVMRVP